MKAASLQDIKKELQALPPNELLELCLSLAKYKKDNKEYLGFLLFDAHDKISFVNSVKAEIDLQIAALQSQPNLYYVKKGLRKTLRIMGKYSKYIDDKALIVDLYIYFCRKLKEIGRASCRERV